MPNERRSGGTNTEAPSSTTTSPMVMRPPLMRSRPATMRSVVVLPQPDGPSSAVTRPDGKRKLRSLTTCVSP